MVIAQGDRPAGHDDGHADAVAADPGYVPIRGGHDQRGHAVRDIVVADKIHRIGIGEYQAVFMNSGCAIQSRVTRLPGQAQAACATLSGRDIIITAPGGFCTQAIDGRIPVHVGDHIPIFIRRAHPYQVDQRNIPGSVHPADVGGSIDIRGDTCRDAHLQQVGNGCFQPI